MTRAKSPAYRVQYRRRLSGKTNYENRLALVKSGQTRMVIRRSNSHVLVQFVDFADVGDKTISSFTSGQLIKLHKFPAKRNSWSAYLVGLAAASAAKKKGVKSFVLDLGMYTPSKGSMLFAALKGAIDAGLTGPLPEDKIPSEKLSNPPESIKSSFESLKKKLVSG